MIFFTKDPNQIFSRGGEWGGGGGGGEGRGG